MSQLLCFKYQEHEWHIAQNQALCRRQNGKFKEKSPGGFNTEERGQKGMKMWLILLQKKKKPRVECVREPRWDRSVYYRPFSTALKHARTEMLHFHFSLGWAVTRVDQTPPFPKWDPLHFTSSIKTFQWSLVGVLSPCKKAPPMGRYPSPQKMKKNRMLQWWKIQAPSDLFNIFFSLLFSLDIILFPQRAQMQSVTNSCDPDTQRPTHTCFMVPQDVSLTPHHFQEIARTHVQIGRLMSGMSASGHA